MKNLVLQQEDFEKEDAFYCKNCGYIGEEEDNGKCVECEDAKVIECNKLPEEELDKLIDKLWHEREDARGELNSVCFKIDALEGSVGSCMPD